MPASSSVPSVIEEVNSAGRLRMEDLRGFRLWLQAAGYRPDTIRRALMVAGQYLRSCEGAEPTSTAAAVSFLAHAAQRVSRVTQLNYYKDLTLFFRFAQSEGLTANDPLKHVPRPRPSLYERERDTRFLPYTDAEYQALVLATPHWNWLGLRDRAILAVLWETPLRASEIIGLHASDIDWERGELRVRDGKAGVKYEALIPPSCALAIDRYLRARPVRTSEVFCGYHREPLTRHALDQLLRRLAKRAGWEKPCSPHYFRHNWRLRMRMLGLDDAAISSLMGHRTVVVTHSYGRQAARTMGKAQLRRVWNG